ncbi:MAG: dihydroneopterin aldolase [Bacteroidetes bacterium]|nr:MAG: dihydroneopterin aldolase [Bacteroidota bacterium]
MTQCININGIKLRANHGCLDEEAVIGGDYIVHVELYADLAKASVTDDLDDTLDYVTVYNIVKTEMAIRSKLIEHVAQRIASRLKKEFTSLERGSVTVIKLRPPIHGNVEQVSVTFPI